MQSTEKLMNSFLKAFEEVLGMTLIIKGSKISAVNLPKAILKINPKSILYVLKPIETILEEGKSNFSNLNEPFLYKQVLIKKYIYSLIDKKKNFSLLDNFINKLQSISDKTYEQNSCRMGFILFKEEGLNINEELSKLGIDYLPFDSPQTIDNIDKNKQSLKLVDSLSISYVIDASYNILGLAKKRKNKKSISNILHDQYQIEEEFMFKLSMYQYYITFNSKNRLKEKSKLIQHKLNQLEEEYISLKSLDPENTYLNEINQKIDDTKTELFLALEEQNKTLRDWLKGYLKIVGEKEKKKKKYIEYIQVRSGKIEWTITPSLVGILSNGKWSIRNYELINHLILEFLLRQYPSDENIESNDYIKVLDYLTPRAKILYNNIKQLSNENIGALMVILKQSKSKKTTIYKKLLSKKSLNINEFTKIIQTDKNNQINIHSCDKYLFELMASVDGAILLDKNFNILSFGEMIDNSIPTPEVAEAGSRTLAAAKASVFGLSIKVSEDGDISIFEDGSPVIKL